MRNISRIGRGLETWTANTRSQQLLMCHSSRPCLVPRLSLRLFGRRGGLLRCTRDPLPSVLPWSLHIRGRFFALLPRHCVTPAPYPRQPLLVPPPRLVPDHAPRRVLPHACCSDVPRAPSLPPVHALVAPVGFFLGRPPLHLAVYWLAVCPSPLDRAPPCSASPSLVARLHL